MDIPLDQIICHDVARDIPLPDECIDVVITSPPYYGLRDYGIKGQFGLEKHPQEYIDKIVEISREIKRVLKKTGSFYLNLGDKYYGGGQGGGNKNSWKGKDKKYGHVKCKADDSWLRPKQLLGIPWRVAIALQNDRWILRNAIIWHKLNTMPSSVKDRLNVTHEHVFHFVKQQRYHYDLDAIREPHKASSLARAKYDFNLIPRAWKQEAIPISGGKNINIDCHLGGKNPGDTVQYDSKYQQISDETASESRLIDKVAFERKVLGVPHDLSTCHPSGKNPGDVVKHDIAVGRVGNFSYNDPLHTKEYHPSDKNPGDFWDITTQPFTGYSEDLEHFAVFPEELVVRPLLASCPRFVCKSCGKPRERIVKGTSPQAFNIRVRDVKEKRIKHTDRKASESEIERYQEGITHAGSGKTTIGWSDCSCNKGFDSGVVLDPFCGRGTVGKVAKKLGFHYVMIDIKPEYCELARLYISGQKHKIQKGQKKLKTN